MAVIGAASGVLASHGMFEVLSKAGWQEMEALNQIRPLVEALAGLFSAMLGFGFGFDVDKFLQRS